MKDTQEQLIRKSEEYQEEYDKNQKLVRQIDSLKMIEVQYIEAEQKIIKLTQDHSYLSQKLNNDQQQTDLWNQNLQNLQIENKRAETQKYQLQERINQQQLEIDRVNQSFKNQNVELNQLKGRLACIDQEILNYQQREIEQDSRIQWMLSDLNQSKQQSQDQDKQQTNIRVLQSKILELDGQIILINQEKDTVEMLLKQKTQQFEKYIINNKYSDQLNIKIQQLETQNQQLLDQINQLEQTILHQEQQNIDNQLKIDDFMIQLDQKQKDKLLINQLKEDLEIQQLEKEDLQDQIKELQKLSKIVTERDGQINLHNKENERLKNLLTTVQQDYDNMNQNFLDIQQNYDEALEDLESIPLLSEEIKRLQDQNQEKDDEIVQWRDKYVEYTSLSQRVKEDLTLFVLLFAEIEGLRDRVHSKDKELEELKQTYIKSVYKQN